MSEGSWSDSTRITDGLGRSRQDGGEGCRYTEGDHDGLEGGALKDLKVAVIRQEDLIRQHHEVLFPFLF